MVGKATMSETKFKKILRQLDTLNDKQWGELELTMNDRHIMTSEGQIGAIPFEKKIRDLEHKNEQIDFAQNLLVMMLPFLAKHSDIYARIHQLTLWAKLMPRDLRNLQIEDLRKQLATLSTEIDNIFIRLFNEQPGIENFIKSYQEEGRLDEANIDCALVDVLENKAGAIDVLQTTIEGFIATNNEIISDILSSQQGIGRPILGARRWVGQRAQTLRDETNEKWATIAYNIRQELEALDTLSPMQKIALENVTGKTSVTYVKGAASDYRKSVRKYYRTL